MKTLYHTLCVCLMSVTCFSAVYAQDVEPITQTYPELLLPIVQARGVDNPELDIIVRCSYLKPKTGVVEIRWPDQQRSLQSYRIDLTVQKAGFAEDYFATVWPIQYGRESKLIDPQRFGNLPSVQPMQLRTAEVSPSRNESLPQVALEGLEPGVNYYWRVLKRDTGSWTTSEVVRIAAPTCPVDFVERQED